MPLNSMRIGETIRVRATVKDSLGGIVTEPENPGFNTVGPVISVTQDPGELLEADVEALAPGSQNCEFGARDSFDNGVSASIPVTVIDASGLAFGFKDVANCSIRQVDGRHVILVDPSPAGDPVFTLIITPVDARRTRGGSMPAYELSDGPNSVSTHGRIILNGHGAGDPNPDDAEFQCAVTARGEETIAASATTAATGAVISGVIEFLIVTAATATITEAEADHSKV